ncbi:MAG: hypothetical protein WBE18_02445 [Gammaproteobacteria bacterium]
MPLDIHQITPTSAHLIYNGKTLVDQTAHPHDAMEFFVIKDLPDDPRQYQAFVQDLFEVVTQQFGGKTSVEIADHIQGEQRINLHLALKDAGFLNMNLNPNVVSIARTKLEEQLPKVYEKENIDEHLKKFSDGTYQIVTDRQKLLERNEEFLDLLEKSGYLPSIKIREGLYSSLGMKNRIEHPNALPIGIFHNDKLIGCVFLFFYADNSRVYAHDVTLAQEFRHKDAGGSQIHFGQALFLKLNELVSQQYPNVQKLWLIGGGDAQTAKLGEHFYKDIFAGESIVVLTNSPDNGIYINFKPPGPQLLNAAQRENDITSFTYRDQYQIKFYPAKPSTFTDNDKLRVQRVEQQELNQRSAQKQQEGEKNRLHTSLQAARDSRLSIIPRPKAKKEQPEIKPQELPKTISAPTIKM